MEQIQSYLEIAEKLIETQTSPFRKLPSVFPNHWTPQELHEAITQTYIQFVKRSSPKPPQQVTPPPQLKEISTLLSQQQPGIILLGPTGTGKTTVLKVLRIFIMAYQNKNPVPKGLVEFATERQLQQASAKSNDTLSWQYLRQAQLLLLDDIGTISPQFNDFGNTLSPFADIIDQRQTLPAHTIISTNLKLSHFREYYGDRLADRLNERYKPVVFSGISFRTPLF